MVPALSTALLNAQTQSPAPEPAKTPVTDDLKQHWNDYVDWLDKKGMKGKPELDSNGLGFKMLEQYKKENPGTLISKETVLPVQKEFQRYRENRIAELRAHKGMVNDRYVTPTENLDWFMQDLSQDDGYPGQKTTSWKSPAAFMNMPNGKKEMVKKFVPTDGTIDWKKAADSLKLPLTTTNPGTASN